MQKRGVRLSQLCWIVLSAFLLIAVGCQKADGPLPVLNLADSVSISEGNQDFSTALIPLTLSFAPEKTVTVRWATRDGTAIAGEEYIEQTDGITTFSAGETEKNIAIQVTSDSEFENDEHFFVSLTNVRYARVGNGQSRILIENDDDYIPGLVFSESIVTPEGNHQPKSVTIPVTLTGNAVNEVRFQYRTLNGTAKAGEDYIAVEEAEITFAPGEIEKTIEVTLMFDDSFEMDDAFYIQLSNLVNCTAENPLIRIIIENDDTFTPQLDEDGFITPMQYPGMELAWSDEFDGTEINLNYWTHEIGAGGWGNNELQFYTSSSRNSFTQDGKLHIVATKLPSVYHSARMITLGKQEFLYGRIDIRAKLPFGQGIWPAFWMLGANFPEIGWPRCGEIDIMEYLGHDRTRVYGSVHYFQGGHRYRTGVYQLQGGQEFDDMFHVFTVVWQENSIRWYVNYQQYFELTPSQIPFEAFRLPHFFIFNIAVGGNWPGNPNHTTIFPQTMMIDYVRVFQTPDG